MIIPYASDEENDRSREDPDITIITDKDIKIETSEVSEDHVKPDNLFAFDATYIKLFKDNSNNQSDDQFLKKFENLKIQNDDIHHRFHDEETLNSNQSISRREDQFLNKEVLNVLNASLDGKKRQNLTNKSNNKNSENSFNEISTIVQENLNFEFSQSDFSINLEHKEKEFNNKCISNSPRDLQANMKNYIPKDQLIKKFEEQKVQKQMKNNSNMNSSKVNNSFSNINNSSNLQIEESKVDGKNLLDEKQMEVIYELNEPNESEFTQSSKSSISNGKDKLSLFNRNQNNHNSNSTNINNKNKSNNQNENPQTVEVQGYINNSINNRSKNSNSSNSQNNNQNKKKRKLNHQRRIQNLNSKNNKNNNYFQQAAMNENSQKAIHFIGNSAVNSNISMGIPFNGIYETNLYPNPNINLVNYSTLTPNNAGLMQGQINSGFQSAQNQLYLNPYNVHQNYIGQQIPLTLNIPSHQAIPGSIPVNIQTNGSYYYNYVPGVNNNAINHQYPKANVSLGNSNFSQPLNGDLFIQRKNTNKDSSTIKNQVNSSQKKAQQNALIQNNKVQNSFPQTNSNNKSGKTTNIQPNENLFAKNNNQITRLIQNQNDLINGEDFRNHFINSFTTSNPAIVNLNQIQLQNPIINASNAVPYTNNKMIPINPIANTPNYNACNEDDSAFTVNASDLLKNPKTRKEKENKILKMESMRNGKSIQIPCNNFSTNQINNANVSFTDYTQQNSTFISNSANKLMNDNSTNVISSNLINSQKNFLINENFNIGNQKQTKTQQKKNSLNNSTNVSTHDIINRKGISAKIATTAAINPLQGNLNPYLIQNNNIPISLNLPVTSQPMINPINQVIGSLDFAPHNNINTRVNVDNSAFLNSQMSNFNKNTLCEEPESEEESDESKEDEYVLELIYSRRFSELPDKDLLSNLFLIAKEQAGCRFLQQKIDDNPNFANYELYPEIHEFIGDFICDPFGNYLVQKMLESLTTDKINHMMKNVVPNFFKYSTNPHGTRVIQKILDLLTQNNQIKSDLLFEEIRKYSLDLLKDFNGIHVIQKIVTTIPALKNFVYEILQEHIVAIATNKHGCCALQKCLELADKFHKDSLINAIIKNSIILMTDQFGNYVIQFVISLKDQNLISRIINNFKNNIEYLSKQKFASNVIEKCFDSCSEENKFCLVVELAKPNIISELIVDNYGNFVLQKAMSNCQDPYYSTFISNIGPNLYKLKNFQWGPKLYNKIINAFTELQAYVPKKKNKIECY